MKWMRRLLAVLWAAFLLFLLALILLVLFTPGNWAAL